MFCEAVKKTLESAVRPVDDSYLEQAFTYISEQNSHRGVSPIELLTEASHQKVNKVLQLTPIELSQICIILLRNEYPNWMFAKRYGWLFFFDQNAVIDFFQACQVQEFKKRDQLAQERAARRLAHNKAIGKIK